MRSMTPKPDQRSAARGSDGLLDGTICPDCAEPVAECQAKANIKGACWRWNDARDPNAARGIRRRVPPLQYCQDPVCGHSWRGWSTSCPECASRDRGEDESLRAFRRRLQAKPRDAA